MEQPRNTPYEPLMRAPLKLRGVFGMAWQLYKRGFWSMFAFVLILSGIVSLPNILLGLSNTGASQPATKGISLLIAALSLFLVAPAQNAVVFMELEERVAGRSGTLGQLFRFALPIGLKRFYSTYFAMFAMILAVGMIFAVVILILCFIIIMSSIVSALQQLSLDVLAAGTWPSELLWVAVLLCVMLLLFYAALGAFFALVFPAAVHEGRRSFNAVSRGMRLSTKRMGRMLLYGVLFSTYLIALGWLPLMFLRQNTGVVSNTVSIVSWLIGALFVPYWNALAVAMYVDSAARVDAADALAASLPKPPPSQYYPTARQSIPQPLPDSWIDTDTKSQDNTQE